MPPLGTINNPKGRGKGIQNKVTAGLKERIKIFLDGNFDDLQVDFQKLEPVQKLNFYERMIKYILPVQNSNDLKLDFEKLSDEQLNQIISKLLSDENKTR